VIAAEKVDLIPNCLDRTEITLVFCFKKQIGGSALIRVALV